MNHSEIRIFLISLFLLWHFTMLSQANQNLHDPYNQWDGVTHWSKYMRVAPKYFGPNALPIPPVMNGNVIETFEAEISGEFHYNKFDPTKNIFTRLEIPIIKKKVNLELFVVPIEFYNMDTSIRIQRRTFQKRGKGYAGGDIYVINKIQILKDKPKLPDVALRIGLRTASGTHLSMARYTDAPGYFFDLSLGKKMYDNSETGNYINVYFSGGFYCWQTNSENQHQNDAYMFGLGSDFKYKKVILSLQTASYQGYIGNGDKPWVVRSKLKTNFIKALNFEIGIEQGLHDYDYSSVKLGILYQIKSLSFNKL